MDISGEDAQEKAIEEAITWLLGEHGGKVSLSGFDVCRGFLSLSKNLNVAPTELAATLDMAMRQVPMLVFTYDLNVSRPENVFETAKAVRAFQNKAGTEKIIRMLLKKDAEDTFE